MKITKADVGRMAICRNGQRFKISFDGRWYHAEGSKYDFVYGDHGGRVFSKGTNEFDIVRIVDALRAAQKFKRGDEVTWTSQASGYSKKKRGVIVEVVKPGTSPAHETKDMKRIINAGYAIKSRNHRSYIVKTSDGKLYWPLVKYLKPVKSNGKGKR